MKRIIEVVFGHRPLKPKECTSLKKYAFYVDKGDIRIGDFITSPLYATPVTVCSIHINMPSAYREINLKTLIIDKLERPISEDSSKVVDINNVPVVEKQIKKENNVKKSMFSSVLQKYKDQFIPTKAEDIRISLDGCICVDNGEGEYVSINSDNELTSYPEGMCFKIPALIISKPANQVKIGDIIAIKNSYLKVLKINKNGSFHCMSYKGYSTTKTEVKDFLLQQSLVKVVFNFMEGNTSGINPMMMMMLGEEETMDMKEVMMLSMMQQQQGGQNKNQTMMGMNPMMLAMISKDGEDSSMMETIMMMQMMGGNNPMLSVNQISETKE